jgi:leucine dehydrogenase
MQIIARATPYVMTQSEDSTVATALGVLAGLREAVKHKLDTDLRGLRVAVQGAGGVGQKLCRDLVKEGAKVMVADVDPAAVKRAVEEFGATAVKPEEILGADVDVLAPCALGSVFGDETIEGLKCAVIAGAANNQLKEPRHADAIAARGILYAPDFVINAGGVIGAGFGAEEAERVATLLRQVFERSERERIDTHEAAIRIAKEKLAEMRG